MTKTNKVVAAVVGLGLALSIFAGVGALSVNAQAMTLSQLVDLFISLGIIAPEKAAAAKAAVTSSASVSFTKDLTIGSSGADVTALQNALGVSPATGYFGSVTKAAVVAYQKAHGLPSTGYVGALTRAALNQSSTGTVSTGTTGTTVSTTPVVNSGVEGTLTVEKASISNSTVYEGDTMHAVLGVKLQAKLSDINVQRVKLDLGTNTSVYTKVFKTAYLTDDSGKILAQADLNSNTVVKDSGTYYLTLGGFSYNVPKDATRNLWVKMDVYSSIKTADQTSRTITLPGDGVRGTDGAGIDQYGPASSFSQTVSISTSLTDSATLDASVNSANYKAADVVAAGGSNNNELDKLPLLSFDLRANKADVKVTDLNVTVSNNGGSSDATTTTIYLYDGNTLIQSESVDTTGSNAGKATFNDINNFVVSKDTTKTLTVKADVRSASATATTISASVTSITAENMNGTSVTVSGTPSGENMTVRNIGPVFALVGTPTMTRTAVSSNDTTGTATSTGSANFTVAITAVGGDITFGSTASTTTIFGGTTTSNSTATTSSTWLAVYKNGASNGALSNTTAAGTNAIISYSVPSSGVTTSGQNFTISKNNTVQIPVTVQFTVVGASANQYSVQINGFRWYNATVGYANSTSMTDKTEWRTPAVSLP